MIKPFTEEYITLVDEVKIELLGIQILLSSFTPRRQ